MVYWEGFKRARLLRYHGGFMDGWILAFWLLRMCNASIGIRYLNTMALMVVMFTRLYLLNFRTETTRCCSSVVERGIAVSAVILRSVVRPSVAASFLPLAFAVGSSYRRRSVMGP